MAAIYHTYYNFCRVHPAGAKVGPRVFVIFESPFDVKPVLQILPQVSYMNRRHFILGNGAGLGAVWHRTHPLLTLSAVAQRRFIAPRANIALMSDDLSRPPVAITISRKTSVIIKENIVFSISVSGRYVPTRLLKDIVHGLARNDSLLN